MIYGLLCIRDAKGGTAVKVMLICREVICFLLRLHDVVSRDKFCVRIDKVFANAVRIIALHNDPIGNMRDVELFHQLRSNNFIVWFLLGHATAAFNEAALAVDDCPLFA